MASKKNRRKNACRADWWRVTQVAAAPLSACGGALHLCVLPGDARAFTCLHVLDIDAATGSGRCGSEVLEGTEPGKGRGSCSCSDVIKTRAKILSPREGMVSSLVRGGEERVSKGGSI